MKKQTKAQKFADIAKAVKDINAGKPVKRHGAKDGSIPTHPVMPVPDLPEREVVKQCIAWLKKHHIFCNRHDAGSFQNIQGTWGTYGMKGAGDIIGLTKQGRHFEIECKAGKGGRLSLGQQKRMRDIKGSNGLYFIIHGGAELVFYKKFLGVDDE